MPLRGSDRSRTRHETPRWPFMLIIVGLLAGMTTSVLVSRAVAFTPASPASPGAPAAVSTSAVSAQPGGPAPDPNVVSRVPTVDPGPAADAGPDLSSLTARLQETLSRQEGLYGVYVIDVATGVGTGINADTVFPTASTVKLPIVMYVLNQVEQGKTSLAEMIAYDPSDWEDGTGILQDEVHEGLSLRVQRLVDLAITESDNIATNMLVRHFGADSIAAYMERLGGTVTRNGGVWSTTPREMAGYMQQAHSAATLRDPALRRFLRDLLASTVFADRAAAGVPAGVKVEHKIGTLPNVVNDVALVIGPQRSFIISALSMDVIMEEAPQVIAEVTRIVYDFETALGPATPPVSAGGRGLSPG